MCFTWYTFRLTCLACTVEKVNRHVKKAQIDKSKINISILQSMYRSDKSNSHLKCDGKTIVPWSLVINLSDNTYIDKNVG